MPKLKAVNLRPRDYNMLRDVYEFYFLDHHTALKRYFADYAQAMTAKASFNRRMKLMVDEELIAPTPFFSDRRRNDRGGANYAYTLTKRGVLLLSDFFETELDWDTSRKDRKNPYIQHHLNVLYFAYLYSKWIDSGYIVDYFGEQSSRYQRLNAENVLKDFVKPDSTLLFREEQETIPWLVEYERNSRASKSTILTKLQNYATYFTSAYYLEHPVLTEHDVTTPPVLLLYCEDSKVASRRLEIISQSKLRFYSSKDALGAGDILIGRQQEIEADPYGAVYVRFTGERVTITQINAVQQIMKAFIRQSLRHVPSFLSAHTKVFLDGIVRGEGSAAVRYYPASADEHAIDVELKTFAERVVSDGWKSHPVLRGEAAVKYLFIAETPEQETWLFRKVLQLRAAHGIDAYVSRRELLKANPLSAQWLRNESGQRESISL